MDLIFGALLGGFFSWLITYYYAKEAKKDLEINNSLLKTKLEKSLVNQNNIDIIIEKIKKSEWESLDEYKYISKSNALLSIQMDESSVEKFENELWLEKFPAPSQRINLYIKLNNQKIKEFIFILGDGGRYLIPLPKVIHTHQENYYYWEKDSIEYSISKYIGRYYREPNLESCARFLGIGIENTNIIN